jgi:hypothetical protein
MERCWKWASHHLRRISSYDSPVAEKNPRPLRGRIEAEAIPIAKIALILGAGFSTEAGLPTTTYQLGERFLDPILSLTRGALSARGESNLEKCGL